MFPDQHASVRHIVHNLTATHDSCSNFFMGHVGNIWHLPRCLNLYHVCCIQWQPSSRLLQACGDLLQEREKSEEYAVSGNRGSDLERLLHYPIPVRILRAAHTLNREGITGERLPKRHHICDLDLYHDGDPHFRDSRGRIRRDLLAGLPFCGTCSTEAAQHCHGYGHVFGVGGAAWRHY